MKKVVIIIPCYNEEDRLPLNKFFGFLQYNEVKICFVNDGSTDNTIGILNCIKDKFPEKIFICDLKKNGGKANAIYHGYHYARKYDFETIGYLDADLATSLEEFIRISNYLEGEIKFVFGSRVRRIGSNIERKLSRHLIGRVIATIISSFILKIPIYDSQCGAKVFSKEIAEIAFEKKFETEWLFDVEILQRILRSKRGLDVNLYAKEIPLENWTDIGESKIKTKHYLKIISDLHSLYNNR